MEIIVGGIIEKDNKILMVKEAKKKCHKSIKIYGIEKLLKK